CPTLFTSCVVILFASLYARLSTLLPPSLLSLFYSTAPPTTEIYTLSLHDALPISSNVRARSAPSSFSACAAWSLSRALPCQPSRSEEHTSELQSRVDLVCRLLLEKKKKKKIMNR